MSVLEKAGHGSVPASYDWAEISRGLLWLMLACITASIFFYAGMVDLWIAWQEPEYSHGPLIPIISGYLFLRQMKGVSEAPGPVVDRWPGVAVLLIALLVGLLGNITQIEGFVSMAIIIWSGGLILVCFGWNRGKQFWPPVLHLAFMLPLPFILYWKMSIALQLISSELGVMFIRMMDIPVYLEGNIIDLGNYKLHVAEACSGLRYLFPIMSFTYLFAVLYQGSIWHKAILLFSAIPIAIFMNSVRVGFVGIIVENYGIEHAEGFMHYFEGWVVFLLCIGVIVALARVLQRLAGDRRSLVQVLDVDFSGIGNQLARVRHIQPSSAFLGTTAVFAVAAFLWNPLTKPEPPMIERDPFLVFPRTLGEWRGTPHADLPAETARVLAADDYLTMSFQAAGATAPVDLFIAWYRDQTRAEIHSPEVCIPAGGWEMSEIQVQTVVVQTNGQNLSIPVNRAIIQKGLKRQLVYYWFDQSGRRLASDYAAKFYLTVDALRTGRTDGALVRFITPIADNETVQTAEDRLQSMIGATMPTLPRFIATELKTAAVQPDSPEVWIAQITQQAKEQKHPG